MRSADKSGRQDRTEVSSEDRAIRRVELTELPHWRTLWLRGHLTHSSVRLQAQGQGVDSVQIWCLRIDAVLRLSQPLEARQKLRPQSWPHLQSRGDQFQRLLLRGLTKAEPDSELEHLSLKTKSA